MALGYQDMQMNEYKWYYHLYGTAECLRYFQSYSLRPNDQDARPFYTYVLESELEIVALNITSKSWSRYDGYYTKTNKRFYENYY